MFNVDFALGPDNDKTLNILGQERKHFWCSPDYILDWYKKISNIQLKDDILKEINDKFTPADDVSPISMPPNFS